MFPVVAVAAASLPWGRSLLSDANRVNRVTTAVTAAVFLLCCFAPIIIVAGDGPQLELDISGNWLSTELRNCYGFRAGQNVYTERSPDLVSHRDDPELQYDIYRSCEVEISYKFLNQSIFFFHDCMEFTSTDGNYVHHWIMDGQYIIDDFMFGGQRLLAQATIEEPLPPEADDGATATMVLYGLDPESMERISPVGGKRYYINNDGNLVITRDMMGFLQPTFFESRTKGTFIYERIGDVPGCSGYDSESDRCSNRVYTDETRNWTAACCEEQGGYDFLESVLFPNRPDCYDGELGLGIRDCDVPSSD